jgi:hypothetical protein
MDRASQKLELATLRALLVDAEKDTVRLLQGNSSTEESLYVSGMQAQLAQLSRIVERQIEGRATPRGNRELPQVAARFLSLLKQVREAHVSIEGNALVRLADRLAKELPGSKVRFVSRVPAPITPLRGTWVPADPKPTEIPSDFPAYFPNELKARTAVILAEAVKEFPVQTRTPELCKRIVSQMTPLFCEAVEKGTMTAGAVLEKGLGGMADLLHSLLVYNCNHDNERFRLEQEARKSDEWLRLAKAIVKAEEQRTHPNPSASTGEGRKWKYVLSESELASRGELEKLKSQLEHDGAKSLKVYPGVWQVVGSLGKTIIREQGSNLLYGPAAPRELLAWLEACKLQGPLVIEAELPPLVSQSETQEPSNYHKEMERVCAIPNDTAGILLYGRAWPHVRELAAIEKKLPYTDKPIELEAQRKELRKILLEDYPEAAEKIGLTYLAKSRSASTAEGKSNAAAGPFTHSADYRSVTVRGEPYTLTPEQAQIIEILHEAHRNGTPDISSDHIMERLGKGTSRWQDTFRSTPKAKQALIKSIRKGTLRLNV